MVFASNDEQIQKNGEAEAVKYPNTVPLIVKGSKSSLNQLINSYLQKEAKNDQLNYRVQLEDKVYLYGTIQAFNKNIEMKMTFQPEVKKDGNLLLHVEELSIGLIQLPLSYVLKYMNKNYEFPQAVKIDSTQQLVDIQLNELSLKNNFKASIQSFDLVRDDISFKMYVPLLN